MLEPLLAALASPGYPALFGLSFLAATLLPVGSEWLVAAMLLDQRDPVAVTAVAAAGNTLGACTTWLVGIAGGPFLVRRVLRIGPSAEERAVGLYRRYGVWTLFFSWLPLVGDPLCLAAGVLRIGFGRFVLFVFTGKLARYAAVTWLTLGGMRLFAG